MSQITAGRNLRRFKPRKLIAQSTGAGRAALSRACGGGRSPLNDVLAGAGDGPAGTGAGRRTAGLHRPDLPRLVEDEPVLRLDDPRGRPAALRGRGPDPGPPESPPPREVRTLTRYIGPGLLAIALLQAVEALGAIAGLVLAVGITYRSQPYLRRHAQFLARVIRGTFPLLACVPVILVVAGTYGVVSAERRALTPCRRPSLRRARTSC